MAEIMPKNLQIITLKNRFTGLNPGMSPDLVDWEAHVDAKLTLPENMKNLQDKFPEFHWFEEVSPEVQEKEALKSKIADLEKIMSQSGLARMEGKLETLETELRRLKKRESERPVPSPPAPAVTVVPELVVEAAMVLTEEDQEAISSIKKYEDVDALLAMLRLAQPPELSGASWSVRQKAVRDRLLDLRVPRHPSTQEFLRPLRSYQGIQVRPEMAMYYLPGVGYWRILDGKLTGQTPEAIMRALKAAMPEEKKRTLPAGVVRGGGLVRGKIEHVIDAFGSPWDRDAMLLEWASNNLKLPSLFFHLNPTNQKRAFGTNIEEELAKRGIR